MEETNLEHIHIDWYDTDGSNCTVEYYSKPSSCVMEEVRKLPTQEESAKNFEKFERMMELSMLGLNPQDSIQKYPIYKVKIKSNSGTHTTITISKNLGT